MNFFTINLITWPQCGECPTHRKVTAYETLGADRMVQIMQECHALSVHTPKITQTDVSWKLKFSAKEYDQNSQISINLLILPF